MIISISHNIIYKYREEEDLSQNGKNSKRKLEKALFLFLADTKVKDYPWFIELRKLFNFYYSIIISRKLSDDKAKKNDEWKYEKWKLVLPKNIEKL